MSVGQTSHSIVHKGALYLKEVLRSHFFHRKIFFKIVSPPLKKIKEAIAPITTISFDRRADYTRPRKNMNATVWNQGSNYLRLNG